MNKPNILRSIVWFFLFIIETLLVIAGVVYVYFAMPEIFKLELDTDAIEGTIISIMTSGVTTSVVSMIVYAFSTANTRATQTATSTLVNTSQTTSASLLEFVNKIADGSNASVEMLKSVNELLDSIKSDRLAKQELAQAIISKLTGDTHERA